MRHVSINIDPKAWPEGQSKEISHLIGCGITPKNLEIAHKRGTMREMVEAHRVRITVLTGLCKRWGIGRYEEDD